MIKFIASISFDSHQKEGKNIALIVQPLYIISWPFYMMALGLFLRKKGKKVTYIVDDSNFEKNRLLYELKMVIIKRCMRTLSVKGFNVVSLSDIQVSNEESCISSGELMAFAHMQAIWFTRGEMEIAEREKEYTKNLQKLTSVARAIESTVRDTDAERIIVAGGIVGTSGIYLKCGKVLNIPVSTIDGGVGVNLMSNSGPAAQLTDITVAFKSFPEDEKHYAYQAAGEQLKKRMDGKDTFAYQTKRIEDKQHESGSILLLLNSVWDQAALGLHALYPGMNEWIVQTVKWVVENTEETIIVRQHPAERNKIVSTKDDYKKLLEPFIGHERVVFVAADNDINTYGLIHKSKVVIAYSTTTALETTMIGKPVITVSNCYYSELGFVYKPKSLEEYYSYIRDGVSGRLVLSESQKNDAALCYYLSQVCNWVFTDFTATMEDFVKWVKMDPETIYLLPEIQEMLDAFISGTPISLIRHKINFYRSQADKYSD
ncbi:MAG: hypothetical protein V2A75_03145 [Pseudomonadota bacterium]